MNYRCLLIALLLSTSCGPNQASKDLKIISKLPGSIGDKEINDIIGIYDKSKSSYVRYQIIRVLKSTSGRPDFDANSSIKKILSNEDDLRKRLKSKGVVFYEDGSLSSTQVMTGEWLEDL